MTLMHPWTDCLATNTPIAFLTLSCHKSFYKGEILCKPILGGHPWQINRFQLLTISHEQATMRRVGDDLRKAYFYR